jgi:hypothetical protein
MRREIEEALTKPLREREQRDTARDQRVQDDQRRLNAWRARFAEFREAQLLPSLQEVVDKIAPRYSVYLDTTRAESEAVFLRLDPNDAADPVIDQMPQLAFSPDESAGRAVVTLANLSRTPPIRRLGGRGQSYTLESLDRDAIQRIAVEFVVRALAVDLLEDPGRSDEV